MAQKIRLRVIVGSVLAVAAVSFPFAVMIWKAGQPGYSPPAVYQSEAEDVVPRCDAGLVFLLLNQVVAMHPLASWSEGLRGHREVSHDPAAMIRECQCEMLLETGEAYPIRYRISPRFGDLRQLQVILHSLEDLPSCSDPLTRKQVQALLQSRAIGEGMISIDGFRELDFDEDSETRTGECIVRTETNETPFRFFVTWANREEGEVWIGPIPSEVPEIHSLEVAKLLEEALQAEFMGDEFTLLDDLQQVQFDKHWGVRAGQGTVVTEEGASPVRFFVEWKDEDAGTLHVRLPQGELPECTSDDVIAMIDEVAPMIPLGADILSIDGHREVSYDPEAKIRKGECMLHTRNGRIKANFTVTWQNEEYERFQVYVVAYKTNVSAFLQSLGVDID